MLNILDIIIIALISVSGLVGVFRGLIREIMSLISWVVSIFLAWQFASDFAPFLDSFIQSPEVRKAAAFVIIFLLALVSFALVSYFISKVIDKSPLKGIDRTLGMVFGILRGIIIVSILAVLIQSSQFNKESWWLGSILKQNFLILATYCMAFLPTEVSRMFGQKV